MVGQKVYPGEIKMWVESEKWVEVAKQTSRLLGKSMHEGRPKTFRLVMTDKDHPWTLSVVTDQRKAYNEKLDLCPKNYFKSGERSTLSLCP